MPKKRKPPKPTRRQPVLDDHKKVGVRLVPPMLAQINPNELSYVKDLLPEVCWIGLANERLGYHAGVELCSTAARIAKECYGAEKFSNFGLCSSYEHLDAGSRTAFLNQLQSRGLLSTLQDTVEPLRRCILEVP